MLPCHTFLLVHVCHLQNIFHEYSILGKKQKKLVYRYFENPVPKISATSSQKASSLTFLVWLVGGMDLASIARHFNISAVK